MTSGHDSQSRRPVLEASAHDVRHIAAIIRGVCFGSTQRATVSIQNAGLRFTVEEARCILAQAYLPSSYFESYAFHPPSSVSQIEPDGVLFEVELTTILTCLDIFGTAGTSAQILGSGGRGGRGKQWGSRFGKDRRDDPEGRANEIEDNPVERQFAPEKLTGLRLTYEGSGYPLVMILSEDAQGPFTSCNISTMEPESQLEIPFDDTDKIVQIIMKSSWLLEAMSELDPSCDRLSFLCSPSQIPLPASSTPEACQEWLNARPYQSSNREQGVKSTFRLLGIGDFGSTEVDFPNNRDVLETFECEEPTKFTYRFANLVGITRALQGSLKTSIRINVGGVLSLQFMMPPVRARGYQSTNAIVEFLCMALNEDEDS